jgi:hypothetical protein
MSIRCPHSLIVKISFTFVCDLFHVASFTRPTFSYTETKISIYNIIIIDVRFLWLVCSTLFFVVGSSNTFFQFYPPTEHKLSTHAISKLKRFSPDLSICLIYICRRTGASAEGGHGGEGRKPWSCSPHT